MSKRSRIGGRDNGNMGSCVKWLAKTSLVSALLMVMACTTAEIDSTRRNVGSHEAIPVSESVSEQPVQNIRTACSAAGRAAWGRGRFRGLVMGESKVGDLTRALGEPTSLGDLTSVGDKDHALYHFESKSEIRGKITASVDKATGTLVGIELRPDGMPREDVFRHFGENCVVTRYALKDCPGYGPFDAGALTESDQGSAEFHEYRDQGVAVTFSEDGNVQFLFFTSGPLGGPSAKCE